MQNAFKWWISVQFLDSLEKDISVKVDWLFLCSDADTTKNIQAGHKFNAFPNFDGIYDFRFYNFLYIIFQMSLSLNLSFS